MHIKDLQFKSLTYLGDPEDRKGARRVFTDDHFPLAAYLKPTGQLFISNYISRILTNIRYDAFDTDFNDLGGAVTYKFKDVEVARISINYDRFNVSASVEFLAFENFFSVLFNGSNQSITFGDNFKFERTDAFSFSCWYRPRVLSAQNIMTKRVASGQFRGYQVQMLANGRVDVILAHNTSNNILRVQTTSELLALTWVHICVTYDGSSTPGGVNIYFNGTPQTLAVIANTLTGTIVTTEPFVLGRLGSLNFLDGLLDEVSIYDDELTASDAAQIYNGGTPQDLSELPSDEEMLSWWRMGDLDDFPNVFDNKGAIDGTMVNMTANNFEEDVPGAV